MKESVICISIVICIIFGNYKIQNYIEQSINTIFEELKELKEEMLKENKDIDDEKVKDQAEQVWKKWENRHDKLAYFIEHNELEKVETSLIELQSYIDTKEYNDSISQLDKAVFLLNHIQDKYALNLENIF